MYVALGLSAKIVTSLMVVLLLLPLIPPLWWLLLLSRLLLLPKLPTNAVYEALSSSPNLLQQGKVALNTAHPGEEAVLHDGHYFAVY